ncbi:MAG: DUF4302 domain-containing protein [Bacteroides sp.]
MKTCAEFEYGWRFDYTPVISAMVNFVMRFKDGRVTMENAAETSESTYKIANAEGPVFHSILIPYCMTWLTRSTRWDGQGRRFEFCARTEDTIYVRDASQEMISNFRVRPKGRFSMSFGNGLGYRRGKDIIFHTAVGDGCATLFLGNDKRSLDV